jgi:hypothetical protein
MQYFLHYMLTLGGPEMPCATITPGITAGSLADPVEQNEMLSTPQSRTAKGLNSITILR